MKRFLVETVGTTGKVYNSTIVEPELLGIISNKLAIDIIKTLAEKPMCAMDVARKLEKHEQNIYYYLNKLKEAGIVRMTSTEARYGMNAKIFEVVSPVIATKLFEDFKELTNPLPNNPIVTEFLEPFIKDGKLDCTIIVGEPYPHGEYESPARDTPCVIDLGVFLGSFIKDFRPNNYVFDVNINENDLKKNLIIIGSPKVNVIMNRLNKEFSSELPIHFDLEREWKIVSKKSGKKYDYEYDAVVMKIDNPFNKKAKMFILSGRRTRGSKVAVMAFTSYIDKLKSENGNIACVVRGIDRDGDGVIDSVDVLE